MYTGEWKDQGLPWVADLCTSHQEVTALQPGERIWEGCSLASANKRFSAAFEFESWGRNGDFVVWDNNQDPKVEVWSTDTAQLYYQFPQLVVQDDGNIVVYKTDKANCGPTTAVWASYTAGNRHRLVLQNDGASCAVQADCTGDNCPSDWCSPSVTTSAATVTLNWATDSSGGGGWNIFQKSAKQWYNCPDNTVLSGFYRSMFSLSAFMCCVWMSPIHMSHVCGAR